jgi:hypothetical protein
MDLVFGEGAVPEDIKHQVGRTISRDDLVRFGSVIPILDRIEHLAFLFSASSHFCRLDLLATDTPPVGSGLTTSGVRSCNPTVEFDRF